MNGAAPSSVGGLSRASSHEIAPPSHARRPAGYDTQADLFGHLFS